MRQLGIKTIVPHGRSTSASRVRSMYSAHYGSTRCSLPFFAAQSAAGHVHTTVVQQRRHCAAHAMTCSRTYASSSGTSRVSPSG